MPVVQGDEQLQWWTQSKSTAVKPNLIPSHYFFVFWRLNICPPIFRLLSWLPKPDAGAATRDVAVPELVGPVVEREGGVPEGRPVERAAVLTRLRDGSVQRLPSHIHFQRQSFSLLAYLVVCWRVSLTSHDWRLALWTEFFIRVWIVDSWLAFPQSERKNQPCLLFCARSLNPCSNVDYRCEDVYFSFPNLACHFQIPIRFFTVKQGLILGWELRSWKNFLIWLSFMLESHWWNIFHKEFKSWNYTVWFRTWKFQTPALKSLSPKAFRGWMVHLLGVWSGFYIYSVCVQRVCTFNEFNIWSLTRSFEFYHHGALTIALQDHWNVHLRRFGRR